MKLFTYGYGSSLVENTIERLKEAGVRHVVDVRYSPNSRDPDYRQRRLLAILQYSGLTYTHLPELGNVNYKGGPVALVNQGSGIRKLQTLIESEEGVCILCVCKRPDGCHRRTITDILQSVFNVEVVDL